MKKRLFCVFLTILLLFAFSSNVGAETKTYKNGDDEITINKDDYIVLNNVVRYNLGWVYYFSLAEQWFEDGMQIYFYTTTDDYAYQNEDLWWGTVYFCKHSEGGFGSLGADEAVAVFTDSMSSTISNTSDDPDWRFFEDSEHCVTLTVQDVPEENQVAYCSLYEELRGEILSLKELYGSTHNISYKTEYRKILDQLKGACNQSMAGASWNDPCVSRCTLLKREITEWDKVFNPGSGLDSCGFSDRLMAWILNIIKWIKYILPVAVIVLGILDFIKAIGSDKDDEVKKAQGHFVKRLIAAALVFLVPLIIQFILEKMGFDTSCSLW